MWKHLVIALAVMGVVAATACSGGNKAKAQVFAVGVDGKSTGFAASFIAYFPNEVQAHPGDTVQFTSVFTGEPHTVTLGKDVDDVFALIAEACPGGLSDPACAQGPPPAYADRFNAADSNLPHLIPDDPSQPLSQAAAQPCFLASGQAPTDNSACTAAQMQPQPAFDGTQTFYNSGFLPDQAMFSVQLAANIAPGTYHYYCLLHREGMTGTITVVGKDTKVPTPAEVTKKGSDNLTAMVTKLQPEFAKLAPLKADTAQAGALAQDVQDAVVDEFGPSEIDIPVGGSVAWTVLGPHTISFNQPEDARPILIKGSDGKWQVNLKGLSPAPEGAVGAPPPDPNAPPPAEGSPPTPIDAGEWDGQGFHSSGFIDSFPPALFTYKLTFTQAGTYKYVCLIHPDMEGTVKVGG